MKPCASRTQQERSEQPSMQWQEMAPMMKVGQHDGPTGVQMEEAGGGNECNGLDLYASPPQSQLIPPFSLLRLGPAKELMKVQGDQVARENIFSYLFPLPPIAMQCASCSAAHFVRWYRHELEPSIRQICGS